MITDYNMNNNNILPQFIIQDSNGEVLYIYISNKWSSQLVTFQHKSFIHIINHMPQPIINLPNCLWKCFLWKHTRRNVNNLK